MLRTNSKRNISYEADRMCGQPCTRNNMGQLFLPIVEIN
jgi:hypothetical protein